MLAAFVAPLKRTAQSSIRPVFALSTRSYSTPNSVNDIGNTLSSTSKAPQTPATTPAADQKDDDMIMSTLTGATTRMAGGVLPKSSSLDWSSFSLLQGVREPDANHHNLHIFATMNNTLLTLTDLNGNPVVSTSAGSAGLKKSARSGAEAGYQAMIKLIEKAEEKKLQFGSLHVLLKGFGPGRDSAFKAIRARSQWDIKRISDTTPIPFNGCRPPKARRL